MIRKIKYGGFLGVHEGSVYVTNGAGQTWELVRQGVSEEEVKRTIKELGKAEAINYLIEKKQLVPVYGGELNL